MFSDVIFQSILQTLHMSANGDNFKNVNQTSNTILDKAFQCLLQDA